MLHGPGHRSQRGLVQDIIGSGHDPVGERFAADVAFAENETRIGGERFDVFPESRAEIVRADDAASQLEQGFCQRGADESRAAGDNDGSARQHLKTFHHPKTSSAKGMDCAAPGLPTAIPEAFDAYFMASSGAYPRRIEAR